jgi:hypothetical protein
MNFGEKNCFPPKKRLGTASALKTKNPLTLRVHGFARNFIYQK